MVFQRFAMLKMFMAAVGTSMLSVAFLTLLCNKLYTKILNGYIEHNSRRGRKINIFLADQRKKQPFFSITFYTWRHSNWIRYGYMW